MLEYRRVLGQFKTAVVDVLVIAGGNCRMPRISGGYSVIVKRSAHRSLLRKLIQVRNVFFLALPPGFRIPRAILHHYKNMFGFHRSKR